MKLSFMLTLLTLIACKNQSPKRSISSLKNFDDSTSYSIGADLGVNLKRQNVEIDYDVFLAGLSDRMELSDQDAKLNQSDRRKVMSALQNRIREKEKNQGEENPAVVSHKAVDMDTINPSLSSEANDIDSDFDISQSDEPNENSDNKSGK